VRVGDTLASWSISEEVVVAGLCHSLYSTEIFKQEILSSQHRDKLKDIVGEFAESVVYYFSIMKRETLIYNEGTHSYSFSNYLSGGKEEIGQELGDALTHILLANDLDHVDMYTIGYTLSSFSKYKNISSRLSKKAKDSLDLIINIPVENSKDQYRESGKPFVRFIGHSGVQIANKDVSIVIEPWLYASSRENPTIEGLDPTQRTVDYLIPEPKNNPQELAPDFVCLSHFHTHHAPLKEILEFVKIKPIAIFCPKLSGEKLLLLKNKIGDYMYSRLQFNFLEQDKEFIFKNHTIRAFLHRGEEGMVHAMYFVSLLGTSIFHVVDAKSHKEENNLSFDESWNRVFGISPDYIFVGAAGHNVKMLLKNNVRSILEAGTLTPVQAAKLAIMVKAKNAGIIGIYNHSVWDDRFEMGASVADSESQFYWALSYLAPAIKVRQLRPGDIFFDSF
jgi:hypothetical protein